MKLFWGICICVCVSVSAEINRGSDEAAPKLLTHFRNFEACLDNFNIHNDKIIRTEDSRAMGAKYISESDMNTRDECLRLCCVTDTCDVFVFEEKRPGSCYLFSCGSPADFKCKFTKHHNYTSGILTLGHEMNVAADPDLPSKHEQELTQLRRPEGASVTGFNFTFGATSKPQLHLQGIFHKPNKTADQSLIKTRQCSRYQFKCRTSGECIAIYNACDGIPQCSDGSDESSELGCPAPVTSSLVPIVAFSTNKTDQESLIPKPYGNLYHLQQQKTFLPDKLKDVEGNVQSSASIEGAQIRSESDHNIQMPQTTRNILKQPETNHITAPEYPTARQQTAFNKPDDPMERNPTSEYSGFRQYLKQRNEQDSKKISDEEHNYITEKLLNERNKDHEQNGYNHKSEDLNLQSHIRTSFLQPMSNIPNLNDHSEHITLFQNAEHIPKTHSTSQIDIKQQQPDLANALRHQLTNVHLSEVQPELYKKEHVESKEAKFSLRNQADSLHKAHLVPQNENIDKIGGQREIHAEDNEHRLRNMKEQMQVPYQESHLPGVPDRSYKYEDEERHIFNHKGYGLVAESDSSEIPYKIAVPNVQFKLNRAQSNGYINNMPEYGSKLQRNMWAESIRPTSHELKSLKNTPQPVETNNGYPLPSDYMYDDGQHSQLNTVSLNPHRPNSDHLSTLHAAPGHIGSLERTNLMRENKGHRDHSHESVSKIMAMNNKNANPNNQGLLALHEIDAYEKEKQISTHTAAPATTTTAITDAAEVPKEKHEGQHHEHFVGLQQAYISELPNDQQQDRPSGALLSMSFGLCITFVMVVLVACRLRVVKRRLRRNGKSLYAHDADYLVNGMYL